MQDAIALGTGNSRYLKTIAGAKELYPTYDDFLAAFIAGTLPVDFNGINPEGWAQQGTELSKATLLTDSTAALLDLPTDEATPNDALAVLAGKAAVQVVTKGTAELPSGADLPENTIYVQYE